MRKSSVNAVEFTEDNNGVHVMDNEHTLCGDAFDAWATESDWTDGEMKETDKTTVTCKKCAAIILMVREVKVGIKP